MYIFSVLLNSYDEHFTFSVLCNFYLHFYKKIHRHDIVEGSLLIAIVIIYLIFLLKQFWEIENEFM